MSNDTADDIGPVNPFEGVTECLLHSGAYEDDCEHCTAETEGKQKILGKHIEKVNGKIQRIAEQGGGVPEAVQIMAIKLDTLLDLIFTGRNRLHYEMEVGMRIEKMVDAAQVNLSRAKLMQGVNGKQMPDLSSMFKKHGKG